MIHQTPRARRREQTLQRIVDVATQLVIEGGFDGLSMHALARQLDYTPGALYRYFSSKDAIIAAVTVRVLQDFGRVLSNDRLVSSAEGPLAPVVLLVFAYRDLAHAAPHRFGLLSTLLADSRVFIPDPADADGPLQASFRVFAPLALALGNAARAGAIEPGAPIERAVVAFASVHGLLQLRKQAQRGPMLFDLSSLIEEALRCQLIGWGARRQAVDAVIHDVRELGDLVLLAGGIR